MYVALNEQGADLFSLARDLVEITRTFCGDLPASRLEAVLEPVSRRRKPKPRKKKRRKKPVKIKHNQQEIYQVVMAAIQLLGAPGERVACSLLRSDFPIPPDRFPGYLVGRTKNVFARSKRMTRPDKYHGPLID